MAEREQRGGSLLQVPVDKRIRGVSPVRYRSRSKSKRSRSGSPLPYLMRDNREKSPFEIGEENKTLMRAAPKAVFDKALVMDISPSVSKPGDEEIIYITTDMSVIDKALVMDISSVTYYVLEDEDEEEEIEIELDEIPEEETKLEDGEKADGEEDGEKVEKKKVVKKVVKKKKKKAATKKEETPPPLKLEIKVGGKKDMKTMFEQKAPVEEAPKPKKPMSAAKLEKLKMIEQMKAEAAAAAAAAAEASQTQKKPSKWDKKPTEAPKGETIEEKMKRIKDEQAQRGSNSQEDQGGLMAVLEKQKKKLEAARKKAKEGGVSEPYELPSKKHDTGDATIDFKANLKKTQFDSNSSPTSSSNEDNYGSVQESGLRDVNIQTRAYDSDDSDEDDDDENSDNENEDEGDVFGNSDEVPSFESKSSKSAMDKQANQEEQERLLKLYEQDEMEKSLWKNVAEEEDPIPSIKSKEPPVPEVTEKEKDKEWQRQRDAKRLPIMNNFLTDRTIREGENLKLTCSASGPDLQIKWYRNGDIVEKGPRSRINARDGLLTLEISRSIITDSGQYSCSIKNKNGEVSTSCIVKVYKEEHDAPMAPTFTSVRDYYHLHGDELIVECHIRGEPEPKVVWYKDGLEIDANNKYDINVYEHGFHRLTINKPLPSDSGKYVIKAENKVKRVEMVHMVSFSGKENHYHLYGIFHADPMKAHKMDSIKKAHEETMQIIAQAGKKEKKEKKSTGKSEPTLVISKNKLNFGSILRDRTSFEGTKVKLVCTVIGPDPQMKWFKNDIPLVFGQKIRNGTRDGLGSIEIQSTTEADTGEYKCVAKNGFCEISTACNLQVYPALKADTLPPTFIMGVRDIYHAPENDLIIDCKVRGHPAPTITWLLNEMEVVHDERIQQYDHHDGVCELIINKPSTRDSGTYTCRAENSMGVEKSVHRVIVENVQPTHSEVVQHNTEDQEEEKQKPKEKEPKAKKGKVRPIETYVPVKNKLVLSTHLTNRTVAAGNKVKLSCCIQGPDPQMKWTKNGNPMVFGPKIKNLSRDGLGVIEFINPNVEDSGEYVCIAKNSFSEISTLCRLDVYDAVNSTDVPPTFTRPIKDTYHLNTNELIIESHVRGQPKPKVIWIKDAQPIKNNDKYQNILHEDGTCELVINRPVPNDSGKYICSAENKLKKIEMIHHVQYDGKDSHIADNIHRAFHIDHNRVKDQSERKVYDVSDVIEEGEKKGKGKKGKESERKGRDRGPPPKQTIFFAAQLTDRVIAEGSKIKLSCYVQGPDPQLKWLKDDLPVVFGPKVKNLSRDGLGALEFLSAKIDDSGKYTCVAKNPSGEITSTANFTVYKNNTTADVPPTFTRAVKDSYHANTNELVLECHVRGLPTPEISWIRDAQKIEKSAKYQQIDHDDGKCELIIDNPNRSDSGKYICCAENRVKKEEIVHMVEYEGRPQPIEIKPRQAQSIADEIENVENTNEVDVEVPASGETKKPADKKGKKGKGEAEGGRRRGMKPLPDPKTKLYFAAQLATRTVPVGTKMKLTCHVHGPEPQIKWLKNNGPLAYGPKIRNQTKESVASIEFLNITMEDAAEYTCVAKNISGEVTTSARINVYENINIDVSKPIFTRSLTDSYHSNNNELLIECQVSGNPIPTITWLKDGNKILENNKFKMSQNDNDVYKLIVINPDLTDSGKYTCRAENIALQDEISHFVYLDDKLQQNIIETTKKERKNKEEENLNDVAEKQLNTLKNKLTFESTLNDVTAEELTWVKMICTVRGNNPTATWFKKKKILQKNTKYRMTERRGIFTLEILDLTTDDSGEYSCKINNEYDEIVTSSKLNVLSKSVIPPSFAKSIKDSFNKSKNELIIETLVEGKPIPTVSWYKDNEPISNYRCKSSLERNGICRLIINEPTIDDTGIYVCRAEQDGKYDEVSQFIRTHDFAVIKDTNPIKTFVTDDTGKTTHTSLQQHSRSVPREHVQPAVRRTREKSQTYTDYSQTMKGYHPEEILFRNPKRKPVFSTQLTDRSSVEGSTTKLTCNCLGTDAELIWLKYNTPIPKSPKYRLITRDGLTTLEIFNTSSEDSGEYTCIARNEFGESSTTAKLKVYTGFESSPMPPTFTRYLKDTYYIQEDELVLECRVRGQPKPDITWIMDGQPIKASEKYRQFDQSDGYCKLVINTPSKADSGVYTCKAENSVYNDKITHAVEFLGKDHYILERTHGFFHRDPTKPHFSNLLADHIVPIGGTIALQAEVHGTVTVEWLKGKNVIEPSERIRTFDEQGVYTLAIDEATAEETGQYTCRASNAFGKADTVANVDVVPAAVKGGKPAMFLSRPETEMAFLSDSDISMSFRIQGDPKPKITWLKGLRDITKSPRTLKAMHDDYTRFSLSRASYNDAGTYCIIARNRHGADRAFVTVTVKQRARSITPLSNWSYPKSLDMDFTEVSYLKNPPGPIPAEPIVVDTGKNHVSLSWVKPYALPDAAPVLAYRVDAWMTDGARWMELGVTPLNRFDAFNLKPGMEYIFRVTPKNRYGWGDSAQTSFPVVLGSEVQLPEFSKILPGQIKGLLNKDITLECVSKGHPKPDIIWYKDGVELEPDDRISIRTLGSICRMTITQITESDNGRYTCEATNRQGRVSSFARVQVVSDAKIYEADLKLKENIENANKIAEMIPQFTMRLRDRRTQVTYPVRLTCQIIGLPIPEITWFKDDVEIKENDHYAMWTEDNFCTLEISKTSIDDYGKYRATAKNTLGSVSCHCILVVDKGIRGYIAPEFYSGLDPLYIFKEHEEIRISAQVEAYPTVGVTWLRDGTRLRPSRRIVTTLNEDGLVELIISDATCYDGGIYTCIASNVVGRVESCSKITIEESIESDNNQIRRVRGPNEPYSKEPMFVKKPRSSEAFEFDTVIILCEVIGDPKPEVVWLRDFLKPDYYKDATQFRRIGDGPEYRLEIPRVKLDFTGTYSVIATNCHGEAKAIISLQIYAKDMNKANKGMDQGAIKHSNMETLPEFIRHLKDLRCCDGDSITLECHVEGKPEPTIFWEKDGRILPHSNDFTSEYDNNVAKLSIHHVYPEDEGEYTCVASNNIGRTYSSACIIVDAPEEKENLLSLKLTRPPGFLSGNSTPRSTPRSTPVRSLSPSMHLSYRNTHINIDPKRHKHAAPKFLSIPHNRVAEEGETVRFQCTLGGHPPPWSVWDKNGIIVTPSGRISMKEKDDHRILEIEEVTFEDAGLYRITLENEYGRIEASARLDIINCRGRSKKTMRTVSTSPRRHINYTRRLMGNSTSIGGRLALSCDYKATGTPSGKKFYHNGNEIQETDRIKITDDDKTILLIENAQLEDEGEYTCICETENGIATTSTIVQIYENEDDIPNYPPEFTRKLTKEIQSKEGIPLDLICKIDSCVPYDFIWKRGDEILNDSDDFRFIDHGHGVLGLRIMDPFIFDSGQYTCIVTSEFGKCKTTTNVHITELLEDDMKNIPEFHKYPLPLVATFSSVASFSCSVTPIDAKTRWSVCGREITKESRGYSIEHQTDGYSILHILGVEHKHSGEIKCTAYLQSNKLNSITCYTDLAVLPIISQKTESILNLSVTDEIEQPDIPAYIIKGLIDNTVLSGDRVELNVIYGGYPEPNVKWMRAGRIINENDTIKIITINGNSTLLLTDITADQSGKYTVEIMNAYSTDISSASVAVEGVPDAPRKPSISKGSEHVSIAWCGPPFDGGCMLTGFSLEMQRDNSDWIEVATVVDSLAYTVKNLLSGSQYRFRVKAENIHGSSNPSEPSDDVSFEENIEKNSHEIKLEEGGDFRTRFEVLEELGKGRFGVVHKVIERDTGAKLAAKIIKCIKAKDRVKVQEEISIMRSLKHEKLLQLAASFESAREIVMVMEYVTGGELFERVVADDFTLTERDCVLFIRQICEGVQYMHEKSVVHLDLKPENIMCHTRTSHQVKIIDFGLAQRLKPNTPVRVLFGTPEFIPPEIINYEPIGFQSDMWSVGVICYVLLSGLSPFMGDTDVDTFSNITRADYDFDDDAFDKVSQDAKDFISNLLVHRKEERYTAEDCLESSWLSRHNDNNMSNVKICTDKLKKFIIRRKWQKTGNAIRALGRMATLSANSRRNSATSSTQNSPRPSISGCIITSLTTRMTSFNEEEDESETIGKTIENKLNITSTKLNNKICTERSDSGFSECSNCSLQSTFKCCTRPNSDKVSSILEEKQSDLNDLGISPEILQLKLEKIAELQMRETEPEETSSIIVIKTDENHLIESNKSLKTNNLLMGTKKCDPKNTIEMRKQSLENSLSKESVIKHKVDLKKNEKCGKVSLLKEKFSGTSANKSSLSNNKITTIDGNPYTNGTKHTDKTVGSKNVTTTVSSTRNPIRLSGKYVTDVSERLSSSKETDKLTPKTINKNGTDDRITTTKTIVLNKTISNNNNKNNKINQTENFKKVSEFWKS